MKRDRPDARHWGFILAPEPSGWRVRFVLGAEPGRGGGTVGTLEEAYELIRSLVPLLEEDETTRRLLHLVDEPAAPAESGRAREEDGRQDRDLLQTVWEASADAMALSDPDGIVLHANPAYCRLYGYIPEEIIGHPFSIIFPEEAREWAMAAYRQTFRDPAIAPDVVSVVRRGDGTERIVEARYDFVVRDGRRVAMLSTIRDITERREAERLAQSQARVLDLLEGAVILTDGEGTIEYCNEAAERLFGRHEEVISRSIVDILPNGRGTESGGAILDCIARGERWEARLSVNGRGTVTPVMLRGNPMRDDLGRSTGAVVMSTPLAAPTGNPELPVDSGPDHADV